MPDSRGRPGVCERQAERQAEQQVSGAPRVSAGLLPFTRAAGEPRVFIAHFGGPLWAAKDAHAWSIVKGELDDDRDPRVTAAREWREETGAPIPPGEWLDLGTITQRGGKVVQAYAVEVVDPATVTFIASNQVSIEWPPRSGRYRLIPEVDRAQWCDHLTARQRLVVAQAEFIDRLEALP